MMKLKLYVLMIFVVSSCSKDFLEAKRDKSQVIPSTITEYGTFFNNIGIINNGSSHLLSMIGSDEYFISEEDWSGLPFQYERNGYIWAKEIYEQTDVSDWNNAYHRILLANIALDGLNNLNPTRTELDEWEKVKGTALFIRAFNYYQLVQLFCKQFDAQTSITDLGIPLRLEADITLKSDRSTVKAIYNQIINDLESAMELLPDKPSTVYEPSKMAVYALLSKTFLHMNNYSQSRYFAELCMGMEEELLDFNQVDNINSEYPFKREPLMAADNSEIIFFTSSNNIPILSISRINIDTVLLNMYEKGDLRKEAFFMKDDLGKVLFKGSYSGAGPYGFFTGLSMNEMYLIAAECYARDNMISQAHTKLNKLLKKRYDPDYFEPVVISDKISLLKCIFEERKKELVLRGIAWEDLRRLNKEEVFQKRIKRSLRNIDYELEPNSLRYIWPIPDIEITLLNLEQNKR